MHEVIIHNFDIEKSTKVFVVNISKTSYLLTHLLHSLFIAFINIFIIYKTIFLENIEFSYYLIIFVLLQIINLRLYFAFNSKIINKIIFNSESKLIKINFWCIIKGFQNYNMNIDYDNYEYYEKSLSGRRLHDRIFIISNKVKYEVDSFDFEKVEYDEIKNIIKLNGKNKYK